MKITLFAALCLLSQVCAFAPTKTFVPNQRMVAFAAPSDSMEDPTLMDVLSEKRGFWAPSLAGLVTGLGGFVARGIAADDIEYAELPPPYVPAIFGLLLVAGVGVLTASLGNVMDEEASLGLQSGARAKKEIDRSRSSYFKK